MDFDTAIVGNDEHEALRRRCVELENELERRVLAQKRRLQIADDVHRSLLPKPVRHEHAWIDIRYIPIEEVGGDYCQVRFADQNTCYITMCDVMGHGVGAALLATRVSSEVRHGILNQQEPRDIVRSLQEFTLEHFSHTGLFLTFVVVKIDLERMVATWSGAGHPSPFVLRGQDDEPHFLSTQNGLVGLDLMDDGTIIEDTIALQSGDRLFLFTDGLFEVLNANDQQLGLEGFLRITKTTMDCDLFDVADNVLEMVCEYQDGENTDDQTLIVAEIR